MENYYSKAIYDKVCNYLPTGFVGFETFTKTMSIKVGLDSLDYIYTVFSDGDTSMLKIEPKRSSSVSLVIVRQPEDNIKFFAQTEEDTIEVIDNSEAEKMFLPALELHSDNLKRCFKGVI